MQVGDLVVIKPRDAYENCLGAVVQNVEGRFKSRMFVIDVPELGSIVRNECDLKEVTIEQLQNGEVEIVTPTVARLRMDLQVYNAVLLKRCVAGDDEGIDEYAGKVVEIEMALEEAMSG